MESGGESGKILRFPTTPRMEALMKKRDDVAFAIVRSLAHHKENTAEKRRGHREILEKRGMNDLIWALDQYVNNRNYSEVPRLYETAAEYLRRRNVNFPDTLD